MRIHTPVTWRDEEEHRRLLADGINALSGFANYKPVKCVDLTNSGADDLTEVDLGLPGDNTAVYSPTYWIHFHNVSSDTATWFPRLQFQTAGGGFRTGGTDYVQSWHGAAIAGTANDVTTHISVFPTTGAEPGLITGDAYIHSARDSSSHTHVTWWSGGRGTNVSVVGEGHGHVQTAEDNDVVRFTLGGVHQFDSGELVLLMQDECR